MSPDRPDFQIAHVFDLMRETVSRYWGRLSAWAFFVFVMTLAIIFVLQVIVNLTGLPAPVGDALTWSLSVFSIMFGISGNSYAASQSCRDRPVTFSGCFRAPLHNFLPLLFYWLLLCAFYYGAQFILLRIAESFDYSLSILFLFYVSIWVFGMLTALVMPAIIFERLGIVAAMRRGISLLLTRPLSMFVMWILFALLIALVLMIMGFLGNIFSAFGNLGFLLVFVVLVLGFGWILNIIGLGLGCFFYEARRALEGDIEQDVVQVFE